jgi:predicted nucleic acid-binding protein
LFLDTSVLVAASASSLGASRELFRLAPANGWVLVTTPYALDELLRHLLEFPAEATHDWASLRSGLLVMDDVFTLEYPVVYPVVFPVPKNRPILFGALSRSDVLLTLDRNDFGKYLGDAFYGMPVLKPGTFLERERAAGRLV